MSNYLEELAEHIRREVPSDLLPGQDTDLLFMIYAVLARAKGTQVEAEDVHDAWVAWMTHQSRQQHSSIRRFADLPEDIRAQDLPFVEAIHRAASRPSEA